MIRRLRAGVIGASLLAIAGTASPAAAQAPAPGSGIEIGGAAGFSDAGDPVERGYDLTATLQKPISRMFSVVVQTGVSGLDVTPDPDVPLFPADTLRLCRLTAGGALYPRGLESVRLRPYLTAGAGLYRYTFAVNPAREVRFGVHAGFGLEGWPTGRIAVTAEAIGRFIGSADGTPVGAGGVFSIGGIGFGVRAGF